MDRVSLLLLCGFAWGSLLGMAPSIQAEQTKPRLLLIGDSTVKNGQGDGEGGLWGWGQVLAEHFDLSTIEIDNRALGGRSSRTYLSEGLWEKGVANLMPGDFVLIQFGHNDGGEMFKGARPRASIKGNGNESKEGVVEQSGKSEVVQSYGWYLRKYVEDAKAKGATPIILSPVPRNMWKEDKLNRASGDYGKWAKEAAIESGATFVDLNEIAATRYESIGQEVVSKEFFPATDHTHTTRAGAKILAECVIEGLKSIPNNPLKKYFVANRDPATQPPRGAIPPSIKAELDIPYADDDNPRHRLDLYLPKKPVSDKPLPVVVFIHGGGWQNGNKQGGAGTVLPLVSSGEYIGASIGYRLSGEAIWPAQIHDCKGAIRWLKANATKYHLDPDRIGVTGNSAGGHLVAMLGTTGDVPTLEGTIGSHLGVSSRVACVVDQFGPTDLLAMGGSHNQPGSPESKLIGGPIQENQEAARTADPIRYVTADDPPFMIIHGTNDPLVPFNQSELLLKSLQEKKVTSFLVPVQGGGHGNFKTPEVAERLKLFFDKHLRGQEATISSQPIISK